MDASGKINVNPVVHSISAEKYSYEIDDLDEDTFDSDSEAEYSSEQNSSPDTRLSSTGRNGSAASLNGTSGAPNSLGIAAQESLSKSENSPHGGKPRKILRDSVDSLEIFDLIRHLNDPEHPLTLEQLNVLSIDSIKVDNEKSAVDILFTPTIPHCSMATLIGLSIRVKLLRSLPSRYKVSVRITPGTHASEDAVNKQLADKERVAAALENSHLLAVVNKCIANTDKIEDGLSKLLASEL